MRLVYDLQAYTFSRYGGITRIFDELFRQIAARPTHSAKLCLPGPPLRLPPLSANVRVCSLHTLPNGIRQSRWTRGLYQMAERAYWRAYRPQLFHPSFYPEQWPFPRLPSVVNVYDLVHEKIERADNIPDHRVFLARKKRALERADRVICISEATRDDLAAHYAIDPARVRVVHLGYDEAFQPLARAEAMRRVGRLLPSGGRPFMLYVGARQRYKNFHRLVRAYAAWPRSAEVDLLVVGPEATHEDHLVLDLGGAPAGVRFLGGVSDEQLCALYNLAAFLVYPSLAEGFGIPLLEAAAARCPLCLSALPVFREVAGPNAVYFDPLEPESMHRAFDACLAIERPPEPAQRPDWVTRFSWQRTADAILAIYRDVLGDAA